MNKSRLMLVSFTYCELSSKTLSSDNYCDDHGYSSIDLQTIHASEEINQSALRELFGIHDPFIKNQIETMVSETHFESVFISYSFKDETIARNINDTLRLKGINTFLWQEDAPGGKKTKEIMKENIGKYDRVIFIASENSLKSEACHFELTEGRKKQDKLWKTVFIPVHIDDFLFTIEIDSIRPKEKREEFWKNIGDIKEINSIDFSMFNKPDYDLNKFETQIGKLIASIKTRK